MHRLLPVLVLFGCSTPGDDAVDTVVDRGPWITPPPSVITAPGKVVAFADVHGDYLATLEVLQLAGLVNEAGTWIGGDTVAVQTGDQLDRGDGEQAILDLFESLSEQAWAAGGGFYPLLGNHETMQVELDFRYVTAGGWADFADTPYDTSDSLVMGYPEGERGRVAAFRPGGPYAMVLAGHNLAMQVDDTVFVHGGILPSHAEAGLARINGDVQSWMRGETSKPSQWIGGEGPVWNRLYSDAPDALACDTLTDALQILGAERMVVGHTVQDMANPACDGRVWLMDVGMAAYYGGSPAALSIEAGQVQIVD
ncbi:MAG: calcineurin [Deltaproteobacteria bacterium]|nr:MAG: calcineurin [Deltaproteobacteria bacterium]